MSLRTVLQIGKALRNSDNNLKYFKYVEPCPKDKDGNYPICITIPVKEDFSFDWGSVKLTPEAEKEKLFYLKFTTSDADSSAKKYLFGDIYYARETDVDAKNKVKAAKDCGNYTFEKGQGNAFTNGLKKYNEILDLNQKQCLMSFLENISDSKLKHNILKAIIKKYNDKEKFKISKTLELEYTKIKKGCELLDEYSCKNYLIRFHSTFEQNLEKFRLILLYAPAFEDILSEGTCTVLSYLDNIDELKKKYIQSIYKSKKQLFGKQDENSLFTDIYDSLDNAKKQNIFQYADFRVFIHFKFENDKQWYELNNAFDLLIDKLNSEVTRKTKFGLVPDAYIYRTLCSGNSKNDIQFPNFEIDEAYKSFTFTDDEFDNFLYTSSILNKPFKRLYKTKIDMFVFPIAIQGKSISAAQYDTFFEKTNEDLLPNADDGLFFYFQNEKAKSFNKFDFVLSDSSGNTTNDLIEISGIERSDLKSISERIRKISLEINKERNNSIKSDEKLKIESSLLKIFGTYQINQSGYLEIVDNHRYKSHLLKVLPLIYTKCYYADDLLLPTFINNAENIVRLVKENHGGYKYEDLKYDLKFLLLIQNSKNNRYMEITESQSYQIGLKFGKLAKPLKKRINSFEKKYVGLLTRHIGTKEECIEFYNKINEMLVRQEKAWANLSAEVSNELANLPNADYNKEHLAFGFFEGYFKYESTDKRKDFISRLEKILTDYEGNPDLENELEKLNELVNDINI